MNDEAALGNRWRPKLRKLFDLAEVPNDQRNVFIM